MDVPGRQWRYPGCVGFSEPKLAQLFRASGLQWWKLNWRHPRQTWYAASPDPQALVPADLAQLTGHSLGFQA